jgi:hypothetical protein
MSLSLNDECREVISRYLKYINSDDFKEYVIKFAFKISETLICGYKSGIGEIYIVKNLVENLDGLKTPDNKGFKIYTKSIFIHGSKSHVEFQYKRKMVYSELGDLIFILSVIYKDKKYFEKLTNLRFHGLKRNIEVDGTLMKNKYICYPIFLHLEEKKAMFPRISGFIYVIFLDV